MDFHEDNYRSLSDHTSPRKNVLLLSCMDLRLLDNLVAFMNFENLENRYDQFILAGASGRSQPRAVVGPVVPRPPAPGRGDCIEIKYVYIIEHRDCGAYEEFLGKSYVHYDAQAGHNCFHWDEERDDHRREATSCAIESDTAPSGGPNRGRRAPSRARWRTGTSCSGPMARRCPRRRTWKSSGRSR